MTQVVALVPARDESAAIVDTVTALRSVVDEVIVVDDGSRDATAVLARNAGARVVAGGGGRGKGGALERGLDAIGDADVVLLADGDLGTSAATLAGLVAPIVRGDADLCIGVPTARITGGLGVVRRFAAFAIRAAGGPALAAPLSGQRAVAIEVLPALRPLAPRFGVETAMTMDAARAGLRILEIPIAFTHRATGRDPSGFLHRARQGYDIAVAALPRLVRRRRR